MCKDLMNQSQHLQRVVDHFTTEQIANNRLQLKATIFIVRYLAFQAIAFRGRDESFSSLNRENFHESLGIVTFWNKKVAEIIEKAPKNATYTSPRIQKEILHVFSAKVKKAIREEIGDAKFCIMVDEACDESMKEQMAVVFRYVDAEGFVKERFFGLIHVVDTAALTLKKRIYSLLSQYCLDIQNIRGASCKRNEQLKVANANEIAPLIDLEELEIGSGLNQIGTLQRPGETHSQLQELNYRFNEDAMELLRLSSALEPREALKSFRISDLCLLVKNFYPQDFTDYDKQVLEKELYHFEHNVVQDPEFKKLKSLSELSQWLVRTGNSEHYKLVYRMVILVLTLPISTATTERAFSAMKLVKTELRNKMEDDFLNDSLMLYIEKDIASTFSLDSIVDDFKDLKERRVPFS
ncbi:uncharacterized protein LOC115964405 [Quercus lobata]|uniref:uncharacterized protein LOC115964405 n=1 Tax=Quercus lobata TaxID=97700 RepID=UPI0012452BC3|nr:uncharacterized protein LOC115964405 [Quercus lobata]